MGGGPEIKSATTLGNLPLCADPLQGALPTSCQSSRNTWQEGGGCPQVGEVETQDATTPEVTQLGSKRLQFQAQLLQPLKSLLLLPDPQGQASALLVPGQSFPVPSQQQKPPSSGATASDTPGVAGCQFFSFQLSDCLEWGPKTSACGVSGREDAPCPQPTQAGGGAEVSDCTWGQRGARPGGGRQGRSL